MRTPETFKSSPQTLANRLAAYCRREKIPFNISLEDKRILGMILIRKFYSDGKTFSLPKVKIKEPEGEFDVILYPPFFVRVIDAIIPIYFKDRKKLIRELEAQECDARNGD